MKKIKTIHVLMMMALSALLLVGCGSGNPAPRGATITLTKSALTFKGLGTCPPASPVWSYDLITITVLGSNSSPIAGVDVTYAAGFSIETTGTPPLDLQRVYNVPPAGSPSPGGRLPGTGVIKTDDGGKIQLILGTNIDCPHTVDFTVQSGSSSAKATITVS